MKSSHPFLWEAEVRKSLELTLGKKLFNPKPDDQVRLLKLQLWCDRYCVPLDFIILTLVPLLSKIAGRQYLRRRGNEGDGIGVPISVLTGPSAEEKLKEAIKRRYPANEHLGAWREEHRRLTLEKLGEEGFVGKPKPPIAYPTVDAFVSAYEKRIDRTTRHEAVLTKKLAKQPYRGNPFR